MMGLSSALTTSERRRCFTAATSLASKRGLPSTSITCPSAASSRVESAVNCRLTPSAATSTCRLVPIESKKARTSAPLCEPEPASSTQVAVSIARPGLSAGSASEPALISTPTWTSGTPFCGSTHSFAPEASVRTCTTGGAHFAAGGMGGAARTTDEASNRLQTERITCHLPSSWSQAGT